MITIPSSSTKRRRGESTLNVPWTLRLHAAAARNDLTRFKLILYRRKNLRFCDTRSDLLTVNVPGTESDRPTCLHWLFANASAACMTALLCAFPQPVDQPTSFALRTRHGVRRSRPFDEAIYARNAAVVGQLLVYCPNLVDLPAMRLALATSDGPICRMLVTYAALRSNLWPSILRELFRFPTTIIADIAVGRYVSSSLWSYSDGQSGDVPDSQLVFRDELLNVFKAAAPNNTFSTFMNSNICGGMLCDAAKNGEYHAVACLLKHGASTGTWSQPLFHAHTPRVIKALVDAKCDPNARWHADTPLSMCARKGQPDEVRALIAMKADAAWVPAALSRSSAIARLMIQGGSLVGPSAFDRLDDHDNSDGDGKLRLVFYAGAIRQPQPWRRVLYVFVMSVNAWARSTSGSRLKLGLFATRGFLESLAEFLWEPPQELMHDTVRPCRSVLLLRSLRQQQAKQVLTTALKSDFPSTTSLPLS